MMNTNRGIHWGVGQGFVRRYVRTVYTPPTTIAVFSSSPSFETNRIETKGPRPGHEAEKPRFTLGSVQVSFYLRAGFRRVL
jgi:hypothetical protein